MDEPAIDGGYRKTTWNDVDDPTIEERNYYRRDGGRQAGRSFIVIECPFCVNDVETYLWSLAGGGKRCPWCGAMLSHYGKAYKKPKEKTNDIQ